MSDIVREKPVRLEEFTNVIHNYIAFHGYGDEYIEDIFYDEHDRIVVKLGNGKKITVAGHDHSRKE